MTDEEYNRNVRNDIRQDIVNAIDLLDSRLVELEPTGFDNILIALGQLRNYIVQDREN